MNYVSHKSMNDMPNFWFIDNMNHQRKPMGYKNSPGVGKLFKIYTFKAALQVY